MYPWFALGHLTSYLHISNKLAERGHKVSFLMPRNTINKLEHFNHHPNLISFIPVTIPHVDGLPLGSETTADLPLALHSLLMTAMDLTEPIIEDSLRKLRPHMVFFDFTYWLPALAWRFGIKALHYCTISPATVGYLISPERKLHEKSLTEDDLIDPPSSFPPSAIRLQLHEARREMEGPYCDYLERQMGKLVFLAGPVLPDPPTSTLEGKWVAWLGGMPFLAALKPPIGAETMKLALPEGFSERTKGRGVVEGDWVQQQLILSHPSVEAMVNDCQLVLIPQAGDQFINARIMSGDLKVGVEVEKSEEDGLFTREAVCNAVRLVMDTESELGQMVRTNHAKWREFLLSQGLENSYVDDLVQKLDRLLKS
ncbi:cyanidin 3-O-galactoside 2''-O-xylosyltransferase FGGT1 [Trifolium repens]|nr:cyanidin 3-O-galactoside 2''-O-xylosyltransferase FGGT1 [Trifolium repens]